MSKFRNSDSNSRYAFKRFVPQLIFQEILSEILSKTALAICLKTEQVIASIIPLAFVLVISLEFSLATTSATPFKTFQANCSKIASTIPLRIPRVTSLRNLRECL